MARSDATPGANKCTHVSTSRHIPPTDAAPLTEGGAVVCERCKNHSSLYGMKWRHVVGNTVDDGAMVASVAMRKSEDWPMRTVPLSSWLFSTRTSRHMDAKEGENRFKMMGHVTPDMLSQKRWEWQRTRGGELDEDV